MYRIGIVFMGALYIAGVVRAEDSAALKRTFADPPREYATAPLWVWNDMLTEEQITQSLEDLASQKVKQAFVHPRPGLMTPYLSDDWFRLWKTALREAERLDMNIWIYDENSYPSGFAGGLVPEAMPDSRGRDLHVREAKQVGKLGDGDQSVFRMSSGSYEDVTEQVLAGRKLNEAEYLIFSWREAPSTGWFGGYWYVDLLKPGVTEKFLEITMGAYQRKFGDQFGRRVPGVFTDEPHLATAGGIHWNDHLAEEFQKRWGYNLLDRLPSLVRPVGDWRRVRHNYQQLLLEQFVEHWAKPYHDYCEKHDLEFTGHYWEHGWPGASHGPDNMAMYAWHQRPAIDCLMNRYSEDVHAQFGNARFVRELASVANQMGARRTLCEAYGAGGWDLRFEDMKRIGDWLYVLGVNTMDEHLSYITIRGARKRDHPQSFSYHEPWWQDYHVMANYFARLSAAMSAGEQINRVLVLEPTTTAWMYQPDAADKSKLEQLGQRFQDLINALEAAQVEYDLASEDILARHGSVEETEKGPASSPQKSKLWFRVGKRKYHTVVLPPGTENVNLATAKLLEKFGRGGRIVACGEPPALVDGRPADGMKTVASRSAWQRVSPANLPKALLDCCRDGFAIHRDQDDGGKLFHQRRQLDDGEILFLVNTSMESPSKGTFDTDAGGIEEWNLQSGQTQPYPCTTTEQGVKAEFSLPPCGSLLLFLSTHAAQERRGRQTATGSDAAASGRDERAKPKAVGDMKIECLEPNVLTLDYVDITAGGQTKKNIYFYAANRIAFQANGMEQNPWDSAVQFRDELITKKFPADSGFEATYRFTIEEAVPESLSIVIERPDLYTIACNGQPVKAQEGQWWLDKAFGKIDLARVAKVGENAVKIKAAPFTIYHELEPAYLLGAFSLRASDAGFVVGPPQPLKLGPWNGQGHPFYAAGVTYRQTFDVERPRGRYRVSLPAWYGSVARVLVDGKLAGHIVSQPWECDITDFIQPGKNEIEVVIIGSLKNALGPHHGEPDLGAAWPRAFQFGPETGPPPGEKYHTLGYGLFSPFILAQPTN